MDYAYSEALDDDEWASDVDAAIREGEYARSDFGPHSCSACEAPAAMVAVGENPASPIGEYAMRPHFRIAHDPQCVISGQEALVRKGVVMPARTQILGVASFPAKLIRDDEREVVADNAGANPNRGHAQGHHGALHVVRGAGPRPSGVSTLLPICSHFVSYAKIGFAGRTLELPGRGPDEPARTEPYARAFTRLSSDRYTAIIPNRIVYASLMYAVDPEVTDEYLAIPVFAGPRGEKLNRPSAPHRLRIEWSSWSDRRRESTLARIEQHRDDAKRFSWDMNAKESMLLFSYAQPDLVDTTDFVVDSPADYCILAVQRGWAPARKSVPSAGSRAATRRRRR